MRNLTLRRALSLFLALVLSMAMCVTGYAEEITKSGWLADFTGNAIQSNFKPSDLYAALCELQPGDTAELRVDVKNTSKEYAQWYLSNDTIQTLEDTRKTAKNGGYSYKLTYTSNGVSGNMPNNGVTEQDPANRTIGNILDAKNKKIHKPTCSEVLSIDSADRKNMTGTIAELQKDGYTLCETCYADQTGTVTKVTVDQPAKAATDANQGTSGSRTDQTPSDGAEHLYACNTKTKKIHNVGCADVNDIATENLWLSNQSFSALANMGYTACQHCKPSAYPAVYSAGVTADREDSNTIVLFDSDTVGGDGGDGLYEATDGLDEFFKLCTMAPGGSGYVTLRVKLDGETQGNGYQNTLAKLRLIFAVNIIPASYIEVPDDPSKITIQDPPNKIRIPGDPTYVIPDGDTPLSDIPKYTTGPQTGDTVQLAIWSSAAMLCGIGGVAAIVIWRKKSKEEAERA